VRTVLVVLLASACAHTSGIEHPESWRRISSPHFVLYTDESSSEARQVVTELERNYAVLGALKQFTFGGRPGPEGRVHVVVFSRAEDFHQVSTSRQQVGGLNLERDGETFVVVHSPVHTTVLNHELVHGFVRHYLWRAPTWLNEGLAEFYSNFQIEAGSVKFGLYPQRLIQRTRFPHLSVVLAATAEQFYDDPTHTNDYYAASAMLVHMLNCDNAADRARFGSYIAALAEGMPAEQAWQSVFGDVSIDALNHRLRAYLGQKMYNVWRTNFVPPPAEIGDEVVMHDVDARLLWIQIADWNAPTVKSWIATQLAAAREQYPGHEGVLYWSGRYAQRWGEAAEARQYFERAALAEPDHIRNWMALAGMELAAMDRTPRAERQAGPALEHLRQLATSADHFNEIAWYMSRLGRLNEALPYAIRALERAPGCYYCRDTMAALFFQKGAIKRAVEEQQLALNLIPERAADMRRRYREVLTRYETAAREAARTAVPTPGPLPTPTAPSPPASTPPVDPPQ
jgi:tetratricopeptide (TPR) repeat protein